MSRVKRLEEFDFAQAPQISAARIRELAEGGYIERSEPVVLIGECGTGKSHLATGLCLAACRQKRRVRFTTAAALVNELVEAKQNGQVKRLMGRWMKYELIALDEVGYMPLADIGAEFLFQVISDRAERAALIVTTNLPFWNGLRCFRIRGSARRCWIELPTVPTSSKPGPNHFGFGEQWKGGRSAEVKRRRGLVVTPSPAFSHNGTAPR